VILAGADTGAFILSSSIDSAAPVNLCHASALAAKIALSEWFRLLGPNSQPPKRQAISASPRHPGLRIGAGKVAERRQQQKAGHTAKSTSRQTRGKAPNVSETKSKSVTYADAGVDLHSGERTKDRIKFLAQKTFNRNVLGGIGGFGALYRLDQQRWKQPVLVSSADGVGTKLKVAFALGLHHTVGADLVNHCVNDIAVQGATPLFFLDYLATGKLEADVAEDVVTGMADACRANGCVLIGGETAQMPGFYADGEYDLAGFIVGAVDRDKVITGAQIKPGDVLIGLPSTGLHTNGYSLARKLLFEVAGYKPQQYVTAIKEKAGAALLKVHRSYLSVIQKLVSAGLTTGMAHITGGGITENLPRILPKNVTAQVELGSWPVLPIFDHLRELGKVSQEEMLRTFNMGIGLIAVIPAAKFTRAKNLLDRAEEKFYVVGRVAKGERRVQYT
jgi:phosphoribosylformylglycinamidine cyclo-ligase